MKEKIKPKNGFTIIELMAVIIIIAIIATLVITSVVSYSEKSKEEYVSTLKDQLELAAKSYYSDNPQDKPYGRVVDGKKNIGAKLYAEDLQNNKFLINDVVGPNDEDCSQSYVVIKMDNDKYTYGVCLICDGKELGDEVEKVCEITDKELNIEKEPDDDIIIDTGDTKAPSCDISVSNNVIKLASDSDDLASKPYSFNDFDYSESGEKEVTSEGIYTGYVKDKSGNVSNCSITLVKYTATFKRSEFHDYMIEYPSSDISKSCLSNINGSCEIVAPNIEISNISNKLASIIIKGYSSKSNYFYSPEIEVEPNSTVSLTKDITYYTVLTVKNNDSGGGSSSDYDDEDGCGRGITVCSYLHGKCTSCITGDSKRNCIEVGC